jgi:sugar phosphate isomerase/epimerase
LLKRFIGKVSQVHIKDVSESLARAVRGGQTGIAVSQCALGDGVNAENIRECLKMLRDHGYDGALSIECEGRGGDDRAVARLASADIGRAEDCVFLTAAMALGNVVPWLRPRSRASLAQW